MQAMNKVAHDLVRRGFEEDNRRLFGPFFLGIVICYFLWGIQVAQSYYYYKSFRKTDAAWLKGAVVLLFFVDIVQSVCATEGSWRYMVEEWGFKGDFIDIRSWGVNVLPLTDAITTSLVHLFYAHKFYSLYQSPFNYIWIFVVVSLSSLQFVGGSGAAIFLLVINSDIATVGRAKTWVIIWHCTSALTDVIIAVLMFWKLSQSRSRFKRTNDVITKLIVLTVETGLMTAITQVTDVVLFLGWPAQSYHALPAIISPKVYSNSMLALLNSRAIQESNSVSMWGSRSDKVDTVQINTNQTVTSVSQDYELGKYKPTSPKDPRYRNDAPFVHIGNDPSYNDRYRP